MFSFKVHFSYKMNKIIKSLLHFIQALILNGLEKKKIHWFTTTESPRSSGQHPSSFPSARLVWQRQSHCRLCVSETSSVPSSDKHGVSPPCSVGIWYILLIIALIVLTVITGFPVGFSQAYFSSLTSEQRAWHRAAWTIMCWLNWTRPQFSPLNSGPASQETCMQVRKQQLELDMEQQTGSK